MQSMRRIGQSQITPKAFLCGPMLCSVVFARPRAQYLPSAVQYLLPPFDCIIELGQSAGAGSSERRGEKWDRLGKNAPDVVSQATLPWIRLVRLLPRSQSIARSNLSTEIRYINIYIYRSISARPTTSTAIALASLVDQETN